MPDPKRILPKDVHFTDDVCVILADMNSRTQPDYREILDRYPYADGLRDIAICQSAAPTDAERLIADVRNGRYSYICIGWLLFITGFVNAARQKGMTPVQYADWLYDQCKALNDEMGFRAAWIEAYGEIGNSVTWPQGKKFTKKEALAYFRAWLRDGRSLTEHWRTLTPPETLTYFTHAKRRDENFRNLPIYYSEGTLYGIHEAYRNGFPLVVYEGACGSMDSFQTGIAFVRGGAKMYDAFWGLDLSPWAGGLLGEVTETNNSGTRRSGMTPDFLYRIWITGYMAGMNTLLHEIAYTFFYTSLDEKTLTPSEYGARAMHFYRLTRETLADRGRPVVPFALMLEEEHGYRGSTVRVFTPPGDLMTANDNATPGGRLNIWANRTPEVTPGDWQVHRTIDALFPQPDNTWRQFAGHWPDEAVTDAARIEPAMPDMIRVGEIDPRDCAPFLRDSAWADCFDVILEDTVEEVLRKYYKAVILAGDIQTDSGLWPRLARYAEDGGTILLGVEHLDDAARTEFGITETGKPQLLNVNWLLAAGARVPVKQKMLLYSFAPANPAVKVWARDEKTNTPLVLVLEKGRGRIFLSLAAHGMDKDAKRFSNINRAVIDHLYADFVGVTRNGPPCQMLVNIRTDDTLVTLLNHTAADWHGEIILTRKDHPDVAEVRDVIQDAAYPPKLVATDDTTVRATVRVPAYEIKLLAFGPHREPQPVKGLQPEAQGATNEDTRFLDEIKQRGPKAVIGTTR